MDGSAFESEGDGSRGEGENLRSGAGNEVVKKDAENEEERVEDLDGRVELNALLEGEGRVGGNEKVRSFSTGELAKAAALLAQAGDEFFFRQGGKSAKGGDAPAGEGFGMVWDEGKDSERQRGEGGGFFTCGDNGGGPSGEW